MGWLVSLHALIVIAVAVMILLRRHRMPESRAAWLLIVVAVPYLGAILYILLGETDIGRKRLARLTRIEADLPPPIPRPPPISPRGWNRSLPLAARSAISPPWAPIRASCCPRGFRWSSG